FWTVPRVSPGRIQVDGRDADWPAGRTNGFALAWDEQRLYLLYHATGAEAAFENRGTNVQELFHTGDALDLQLQTRTGLGADRTNPVPGDIRLVFSMLAGKPVCVLYEYHADDLLLLPVTFKGSGGTVSCDKVAPIPDALVEVRRADQELTIEASVPLKA